MENQTGIEQQEISNQKVDLIEQLREKPITLLPKEDVTMAKALEAAQGKKVLVCDINVKGVEEGGEFIGEGYKNGENFINIDHHFPRKEFSKQISSTNLAIEYVKKNGPIEGDVATLINHTDYDSLMSVAIMRGMLPPNDEFGVAAIAADHTGEPNHLADLLQAFDQERDIEFSYRNLELFLKGEPIEEKAQQLLEKRFAEREKCLELVEKGFQFSPKGKLAYLETGERIDSGLLPALMPSAELILLMCPRAKDKETGVIPPGKEAKLRLGMAAPESTDLRDIMKQIDPNFGGRWNAGSNGRNGGTMLPLEEYVPKLVEVVEV